MSMPQTDSALRRKAEAAAAKMARPVQPGDDPAGTVHELLVQKIELEMQNEELRRLLASLESERRRFFELFDLAPVGSLVLDKKDHILEANLTTASLLALPREKLHRLPFSSIIHPQDQDTFYRMRRKLLADRVPQKCELRLLKADGTPLWARLEVSAVAPEEAGDESCRLSVSDITETVKVRDDLALQQQEFRLLAENASDVVFRCSKAGVIEWISPSVAVRAGWNPGELIGRPFREFVHPDDNDRLDTAQISLTEAVGFSVELRIRLKGDGYRWFLVSLRPALDDSGSVTHLVGGWQDIQQVV